MKKRLYLVGLMVTLLLTGTAFAQGHHDLAGASDMTTCTTKADSNLQGAMPCHTDMGNVVNMRPNNVCVAPLPDGTERIIIIDSIDNSIDVLLNDHDTIKRLCRYLVDTVAGRHDVANILRPKSIEVMGSHIIFVASAINDHGKVGILTICNDTLAESCVVQLPCHTQLLERRDNQLLVVGTNQQGYDINTFSIEHGENGLTLVPQQIFRYHVPKQSERIQQSDSVGVGLTVVAMVVVFFALVCIAFIIGGNAKFIKWGQDRRARRAAIKAGKPAEEVCKEHPSETSGSVYAAIAAAIYLYQKNMHDEENTVLTIDKVERSWTPWNAKFYNMNQYFNSRTRK